MKCQNVYSSYFVAWNLKRSLDPRNNIDLAKGKYSITMHD